VHISLMLSIMHDAIRIAQTASKTTVVVTLLTSARSMGNLFSCGEPGATIALSHDHHHHHQIIPSSHSIIAIAFRQSSLIADKSSTRDTEAR
jgi:hypothetical protein